MFEKILEKILIQYFGRFVTGLDKNNLKLGVWSGNMVIENVNLNPDIIEMLELPLRLVKSQIGKMTIKIPWKKLTSMPVEITIENVYISLTPLAEWVFNDEKIVLKKIEALTAYCKKCMKRGLKKKKSEEKDKGYLDKMAIKIMDNIQLKVVNIHVRYETTYNWGITLEMLEIYTASENWERSFIDRSEKQQQQDSMNKIFSLQNLAFYWNVATDEQQQDYQKLMQQCILTKTQEAKEFCNFIIIINAEMKVTQNETNHKLPLKDMVLQLEDMNLLLQQKQFQQIVHFFEYCSSYSKALWVQRKKNFCLHSDVQEHQKNFAILFARVQLNGLESLNEKELLSFQAAVRSVEYNELLDWVQISARQLIKEAKINKATNEKIKKETAWWKSDKKQAQEIALDEQEILAINEQIDIIFKEERKKIQGRPDDCVNYKFQFQLKKGQLKIENKGEGLQLVFFGMQSITESRANESFDIIFRLQNLSLDMIVADDVRPFCYKSKQNSLIDQLLKVHFQKYAKNSQEDASVMIQVDPIECQYSSLFLSKWQEFFNIEGMAENAVQIAAQEKFQNVSNQTANKFNTVMNSEYRFKIFVQIASPQIFLQNWIIDLGNLCIQSEKDSQSYDYYSLTLTDLFLRSGDMTIVEKLQLQFSLEKLKGALQHLDKPRLIVSGMVPPVSLVLTDQLQKELLVLDTWIFPQLSETKKLEKLKKQKETIIKHTKYQGHFMRKINWQWIKMYGILSGNYIYCYRKEHDLKWEERILLKDANMIEQKDMVILQGDKSWHLQIDEQLKNELKLIMDEFKDDGEMIEDARVDQSLLQIQLKVSAFNIKLLKNNQPLYELSVEDLYYKSHRRTNNFENSFIIGDLKIVDFVYKYQNPELQYLLQKYDKYQDALITIENKRENNFSQTKVMFGKLILNWKPDTYLQISQLSKLGTQAFGIDSVTLEDDEAQLVLQGESCDQIMQYKLAQLISTSDQQKQYISQFEKFIKLLMTRKDVENNLDQLANLFRDSNLQLAQTLEVQIEEVTINLVHRQTHIHLGYLQLGQLNHKVEFTQIAKFMIGDIQSLRIVDMTNYPKTFQDLDSIEMLNLQGLHYDYALYNKDFLRDQNEILTSFCKCTISKVNLEYQHQQVNRFLNYFFVQIVQLIFNPQQVTMNDGKEKPKLVCGNIEQLFNSFMNPSFTRYEYQLMNVTINMRQSYKHSDALQLLMKKLKYTNMQRIEAERLLKNENNFPLWVDEAKVEIEQFNLALNNQLISQNINLQVLYYKILFENEMKELFDLIIRNTIEVQCVIPDVEVELSRKQLILLTTILAYNILQNDQKDNLFIHDYHIYAQFTPTEMRFLVNIEKVVLKLNELNLLISLQLAQLEAFIASNLDKTVNIFSKQFEIYKKDQSILESCNIIKRGQQQIAFVQPFSYLTKTVFHKDGRPNIDGFELKLDYLIHQKGKELIVDFDQCKLIAYSDQILEILQFINIDDTCFPEEQNPIFKKQVIMVNWKGIIVLPGINVKENIVARGGVNYIQEKNKDQISQKITATNLEFFICPQVELENCSFQDVSKRHIVLPTYAFIGLVEQKEQKQLDFSIDYLNLQICYEDLQPIYGALKFQQQVVFKPQQKQQEATELLLANAQIYQAEILFVSFKESPVPLFQLKTKDFQLAFTQRRKFIMNWSSLFEAQFFNLEIGAWEPVIEPLMILSDHSHDEKGNPKTFTSISINESTDVPMNINITKQSLKQLINLQQQWDKSIQNVEQFKQGIQQSSPSRVSRHSSIIQSAIEKVALVSPYIIDNQTGHEIELTIINKTKRQAETVKLQHNTQFGLKYVDKIEKKVMSVKVISQNINFKEINQLQFSSNRDQIKLQDYNIGMLNKQCSVLTRIISTDQQKQMIISSDLQFFNNTEDAIEIKILHKVAQFQQVLNVQPGNYQFLPLGFEQSMISIRYSKNAVWSALMELQKLVLKNANYNLFVNQPSLILRIAKPILTTEPYVLTFVCPFAIQNSLLLPIDIYFTIEDCVRIQPKETLRLPDSQLNKSLKFKVKLPAFQRSPQLEITDQFRSRIDFQIRDYMGLELNLQLIPNVEGAGLITVEISGGMAIQNSLGMNIFLYSCTKECQQLQYQPGQPIYQITEKEDQLRQDGCLQVINKQDYLRLSFDQGNQDANPFQLSSPFNVANVGQYLVQVPKENGFMDVVVEVTQISEERIIIFSPRIVVINKLKTNLTILQDKCKQDIFIIPDTKLPFCWFKTQGSQFLKFKVNNYSSGFISTEMQGAVTLPLRNAEGQLVDYLTVTCMEEDKIRYIIVQEQIQKPLYRIYNQLKYDICFYQTEILELNEHIKTRLPSGSYVEYSLDNPGFRKTLTLELYRNGQFSDFVKIELVNSEQQIKQTMVDDEVFYLNTQFSVEERQMIVTISNQEIINHKQNYDNIENQFSVLIPRLNISIICSHPKEELLAISLTQVEFVKLNDVIETLQLRIQDCQIDNNQKFRCTYPVLMTQQNVQPYIPFLSLLIRRAHQINFVNYFESVKLSVQPFVVKLTDGTFYEIEQYLKTLQWIEEPKMKQLRPWQQERNLKQQLCFFEVLSLYPLKFILSFQKVEKRTNSNYLKSAASQAINCDEVSLTIKGFGINNCFTSYDQLQNRLLSNYKEAITANVFKLVGSIDLLGNPVGLIKNVGEGFQDLFEMPYDGFVQGPLEGGIGIVKGVGSLTKGVVSGTFNTVSKITGSVASGISQLSMDDEYLHLRQLQNAKKAKTVVHGFGQGMVSLVQGVGLGIAGLVIQPYQGAEEGGVGGFFKGMSKGLAGLVVKPVTGALDLVSKTTEGVKNTANFFDDKPNEIRKRLPRVFYGQEQLIKNYILQDSEIMYILDKLQPGLVLIDTFVFMITKYKFAYVITHQQFILLEILKKQILIAFQNENLKGFESQGKEFRIYLYNSKITYKERAKVKAWIDQKKDLLIIRQGDQLIHDFLKSRLEQVVQTIHNG